MIKLKDILIENTVRISQMKDANFSPGMVQLLGKKGQVGLDRKSVSALVKLVRSGMKGTGMGRSFTTYEEKINEGRIHKLPNGVKVDVDFKGLTFFGKRGKVFLDRAEMMRFFKATSKYLK
jgi:hypothetical protein